MRNSGGFIVFFSIKENKLWLMLCQAQARSIDTMQFVYSQAGVEIFIQSGVCGLIKRSTKVNST